MSSEVSRNGMPDTSVIDLLLNKTRTMLRSSWVVTGVGLSLGLLLAAVLLTTLTDLIVPLGTVFRLLALLAILIPSVWALVAGVIRPLFRRLTRQHMARRVETHLPNIHNRLVSAVDLTERKGTRPSEAFYRRLINEALQRITGFLPSKVVDLVSLRKSLLFAGSTVLGLTLAMIILSDRLPTALARIANPFQDLPPATGVKYIVYPHAPDTLAELRASQQPPGNYKGLKGDPITFSAIVQKGAPKELRLKINTVDDDDATKKITLWHDLVEKKSLEGANSDQNADKQAGEERVWSLPFPLTGMRTSFTYRVYGGGTWSKKYRVDLLDRPQINSLQTRLHYPEYMGITEPRVGAVGSVDVAGPIGSRVELLVDVEGQASLGDIELLQTRMKKIPVSERSERLWFSDALPQGAKVIGKWQWDSKLVPGKKLHANAPAAAAHGHGFQNAPVPFLVGKNDNLFAYVFLDPKTQPESIMLQWHDGKDFEHRAYWGKERLMLGKAKTVSRHHMGDLPPAGQLVRLEVPAELVGLVGAQIKGMQFTAFGGKCSWHGGGAVPAPFIKIPELYAVKAFPLMKLSKQVKDSPITVWRGQFPLNRNGWYRVVMSNGANIKSRPMKEARITAIVDNPPKVILERPGTNLTVSELIKVPLFVAASDDFGLSEVVLSVQSDPTAGFQGRPVKKYTKVQRSDSTAITLDLTKEDLKLGQTLKYRVEVRDRRGQSSQTTNFEIKYLKDKKAADVQIKSFEEKQDTLRDKLVKFIAEQEKVKKKIDDLEKEFKPLTDKVEKAKQDMEKNDPAKPADAKKKPAAKKEIKLDAEANKKLAALRKELADTAKKQDENVKRAQAAAAELKNLTADAPKLQLLAPEIAKQLKAINDAFQQAAVKPTQDLANQLKQRAQPKQKDPALKQLKQMSDRVQKDLQALKDRLQAVADAEKNSRKDIQKALRELREKITKQDAKITAEELANLRDFIKAMQKDLEKLSKDQQDLNAAKVPDALLKALKEKQAELDKKSKKELEKVKKLLDTKNRKKLRRRNPKFPERPYDPEKDKYLVPPKEQDTDPTEEELKAAAKKNKDKKKANKNKKKDGEEEEPLFLPALGGPQPKLDPRFAKKMRKVDRKPQAKKKGDGEDPEADRQKMRSRQFNRLKELDMAKKALAQDQKSLEKLLQQMQQPNAPQQTPQQQQDLAKQLAKLLQSQKMQQAQAMLQRLQQLMQPQQQSAAKPNQPQQNQQQQPPRPSALSNLAKENIAAQVVQMKLADRDIGEQTVILKMQPKMREELLQGLKKVGPKGYRKFIRDYFRRLTKVKKK